jgi:hypothetical protein
MTSVSFVAVPGEVSRAFGECIEGMPVTSGLCLDMVLDSLLTACHSDRVDPRIVLVSGVHVAYVLGKGRELPINMLNASPCQWLVSRALLDGEFVFLLAEMANMVGAAVYRAAENVFTLVTRTGPVAQFIRVPHRALPTRIATGYTMPCGRTAWFMFSTAGAMVALNMHDFRVMVQSTAAQVDALASAWTTVVDERCSPWGQGVSRVWGGATLTDTDTALTEVPTHATSASSIVSLGDSESSDGGASAGVRTTDTEASSVSMTPVFTPSTPLALRRAMPAFNRRGRERERSFRGDKRRRRQQVAEFQTRPVRDQDGALVLFAAFIVKAQRLCRAAGVSLAGLGDPSDQPQGGILATEIKLLADLQQRLFDDALAEAKDMVTAWVYPCLKSLAHAFEHAADEMTAKDVSLPSAVQRGDRLSAAARICRAAGNAAIRALSAIERTCIM